MRVLRLHEAAQGRYHRRRSSTVYRDIADLSDDPSENRQVAAEDSVLVHASQLMCHAARLAQDVEEAGAVDRVPAKRGIDAIAIAPQGAQQWRRHAFELRMQLQRQKAVEYR